MSGGLGIKSNGMCSRAAILTFPWLPAVAMASRLDGAFRHDDGVAADGRGKEASRTDLGGEAEQARPAHLVALLDRDRVAAVGQAGCDETGESGGRRSGRRVLGDAHAGREHPRVKVMAGLRRLIAKDVGRASRAKRAIEFGGIGTAPGYGGKRGTRNEREGEAGGSWRQGTSDVVG